MVYLYLWTELITKDIYSFPHDPNPNTTDISVIKYKIQKQNTDLAGVTFSYNLEQNNLFPNNFSAQIGDKSKQMKHFGHFGVESSSTGLSENSSIGESIDNFGLSTVNKSTNTATIAAGKVGVKSEENEILAYVHGSHFKINRIFSASDSRANSYTADIDEEQVDNYLVVGKPGCDDTNAINYDETANINDQSCTYSSVLGCIDSLANNYNENANTDDGSCIYNINGCTNPLALNYDSLANFDDGSCDLGDISGITGDPHILTIGGNRLEMPHEVNFFNLIKSFDLLINISTQIKNNEALMKLIYCSYKDSHFIIDIDSLEIIDSDNFNKYFTTLKIGINSIRIQNNINLNSFLFNKEVNGMLLTVKKNSISQENCSGILLSDPIEECTITSLI